MRTAVLLPFFLIFPLLLWAQVPGRQLGSIEPAVPADGAVFAETGDAAIARRYIEWALAEMAAGRNAQALSALERGADYGDSSSDISYLLAVLRAVTGKSRLDRLDACRRALETRRWERYTPEDALFLEASTLLELRRFEEVLQVLEKCSPSRYETLFFSLCALSGIEKAEDRYIAAMKQIMDAFPRETAPVRFLFEDAGRFSREGQEKLRPLVDLAIRRLPLLIGDDPELAYLAAPYLRDKEEARRYVGSYRAESKQVNPASLPAALNLGLVDGRRAVEELFVPQVPQDNSALSFPAPYKASGSPLTLERNLIVNVNRLLRSEEERSYLRRNLLQFTGVIVENGSDFSYYHSHRYSRMVETWTVYRNGMIYEYGYDSDWDGEADLVITFLQGVPTFADVILAEDNNASFVSPLNKTNRRKARIRWERYPSVLDTELEGKRFIPRPMDFFFTPVHFAPLVYGGSDYPRRGTVQPVLTERTFMSYANILEQPSDIFKGGTERVELTDGIPVKSTVTVNGKKVSEKTYQLGRPLIEYLDMDMDGRMETIRRYDQEGLLSTESDWDGDGLYEYAEIRQKDGTIKKFWDFDKDGVRETTEQ
jgi:tetratricopeptide (TPR) repeat protein